MPSRVSRKGFLFARGCLTGVCAFIARTLAMSFLTGALRKPPRNRAGGFLYRRAGKFVSEFAKYGSNIRWQGVAERCRGSTPSAATHGFMRHPAAAASSVSRANCLACSVQIWRGSKHSACNTHALFGAFGPRLLGLRPKPRTCSRTGCRVIAKAITCPRFPWPRTRVVRCSKRRLHTSTSRDAYVHPSVELVAWSVGVSIVVRGVFPVSWCACCVLI